MRTLSGYYNWDSTAIRLRFDYDEKWTCSFFRRVEGVVANKKAVVGAYNDVIVYVTVITKNGIQADGWTSGSIFRLSTLLHTSEVKCRQVWIHAFINILSWCPLRRVNSKSNRIIIAALLSYHRLSCLEAWRQLMIRCKWSSGKVSDS